MFAILAAIAVLASGIAWAPGLLKPAVVVARGMRGRRTSFGDWVDLATASLGGALLIAVDCALIYFLWR